MLTSEYQKMAELEDTYWWHTGRKSILSHQLRSFDLSPTSLILNIGCGTGGMIPLLEQYGSVTNADVSEQALKYCKARGYKNLIRLEGDKLPFDTDSFDAVVATDVLEHIEDDAYALREWLRVLKPGGHLLMTVPAYQWLWSGHDESLHHHRRYTASQVHRLLNEVGFELAKRTYIIAFSFPLIVSFRIIQGLAARQQHTSYVMLPAPINQLFKSLLQLEARILRYISLPFGTSVLAVGRKPRANA